MYGKELFGKPIRPPDHLGGYARLGGRVCRHDLHAEPRRPNRNGREFHQTREYTTVETQGRRDPAHRLSSQEYRHERSGFAEADDSRCGKRFAQHVSDVAYLFSQQLAFGTPDDLECLQDCRALRG